MAIIVAAGLHLARPTRYRVQPAWVIPVALLAVLIAGDPGAHPAAENLVPLGDSIVSLTCPFGLRGWRGDGLAGQVLLKIVCLLMRWLFSLVVRGDEEKNAGLLVPRHENAVLRRNAPAGYGTTQPTGPGSPRSRDSSRAAAGRRSSRSRPRRCWPGTAG